jgi:hypothetical protein
LKSPEPRQSGRPIKRGLLTTKKRSDPFPPKIQKELKRKNKEREAGDRLEKKLRSQECKIFSDPLLLIKICSIFTLSLSFLIMSE